MRLNKQSAGIVLYHRSQQGLEVLLVHPGGPFWKNKDEGAWSIPKGEYGEGEDPLSVAKREFREEIGVDLPAGECIPLKPVKTKSGKVISAWCIRAFLNVDQVRSNEFELEWPPRSGKKVWVPEVDKAEWFPIEIAKIKISSGQLPMLEQLVQLAS
jgi:predicted NUDIX family NTP pyrophosphohydrolase